MLAFARVRSRALWSAARHLGEVPRERPGLLFLKLQLYSVNNNYGHVIVQPLTLLSQLLVF